MRVLSLVAMALILMTSCVSKKKFAAMEEESGRQVQLLQTNLDDCNDQAAGLQAEVASLKNSLATANASLATEREKTQSLAEQIDFLKENNTNLLNRLSDLSIVSKSGAESIKASLETLNRQNAYIQDLNESIQRKDSLNLALVMKLKRSLANINDDDVQVEVKKGVVYVSLSDKLLFQSGSATITSRAEEVLGKIASIVKDHKDFDILVEGHTDSVPIATDCYSDNWDLSVKRATSVVRSLQKNYGVNPQRMTAGGRGEYLPKADNDSAAGRSQNRRTEIIITPKLDQFFDLLAEPLQEASSGNNE